MADNMSTIQNMQQTDTTMTSTRNYWLIMQNRYGIIGGDDYGDLGVVYYAWKRNIGAKEIQEGDIVILMGKEGNGLSFYRGYGIVDVLVDMQEEKKIEIGFSGYTDLNKKPRGKEWADVRAIKGYHDIRPIKKIDKLIFDEITDYQILGVTDPIF